MVYFIKAELKHSLTTIQFWNQGTKDY